MGGIWWYKPSTLGWFTLVLTTFSFFVFALPLADDLPVSSLRRTSSATDHPIDILLREKGMNMSRFSGWKGFGCCFHCTGGSWFTNTSNRSNPSITFIWPIPSKPRTLEFVGPKMKTWFWRRFPQKTCDMFFFKYTFFKNPSLFAQLDDVYKYLRKGKRWRIPMEWRHFPKPWTQ